MDVTRLNLFALCKCLRHAGKVMVLVVAALVGVIWYATVSCAFVPGLQTPATGLRMLWGLGVTMYTALIAMILWSYMATFLTCPGFVPPGWTPTSDEEEGMAGVDPAREHLMLLQKQKQAQQRWQAGGGDAVGLAFLERPRFCKKCQAWKPPRAHHCSMTGRCILKMDHYCVWVLNCVGLLNYKYFVLFLLYTFLGCLASAGLLLKPCIDFFQFNEPQLTRTLLAFISFVFSVAFSLALTGFLVMHLRLIAINQTTIEAYEKQPVRPWPYNRGRQNNFAEVFGRGGWRRLAPFRTREEAQALVGRYLGARYPTESAGQQAQQGEGAETTGEGAGWVGGGRRWSGTLNVERQYLMTVTSNDSEHTL